MTHPEDDMQIALFDWARRLENRPGCTSLRWLFHPPNGGARSATTGARLKRMGVRRGVPDVVLPVSNAAYVGLAGELKAAKGRLTPEQSEWIGHLGDDGWFVAVWRDWADAARDIAYYLGLPEGVTP